MKAGTQPKADDAAQKRLLVNLVADTVAAPVGDGTRLAALVVGE